MQIFYPNKIENIRHMIKKFLILLFKKRFNTDFININIFDTTGFSRRDSAERRDFLVKYTVIFFAWFN